MFYLNFLIYFVGCFLNEFYVSTLVFYIFFYLEFKILSLINLFQIYFYMVG